MVRCNISCNTMRDFTYFFASLCGSFTIFKAKGGPLTLYMNSGEFSDSFFSCAFFKSMFR